jgi:hypothetical protein
VSRSRSILALRAKLAAEVRAELAAKPNRRGARMRVARDPDKALLSTTAKLAELDAMPNRCIDCLCPIPHGNRCNECKGSWPCAIPLPIHFAGNPHPAEIASDTQYHGDGYRA